MAEGNCIFLIVGRSLVIFTIRCRNWGIWRRWDCLVGSYRRGGFRSEVLRTTGGREMDWNISQGCYLWGLWQILCILWVLSKIYQCLVNILRFRRGLYTRWYPSRRWHFWACWGGWWRRCHLPRWSFNFISWVVTFCDHFRGRVGIIVKGERFNLYVRWWIFRYGNVWP